MFDIVLFDLDGTLTDPKEGITKSAQYALKHFGINESNLKKLEVVIGPNLYNSFENIFGFSPEDATTAVQVFRQRYKKIGWRENEIYPGMAEILKKLKEKGIRLGVATLKPEIFACQILELFNIAQYFDVIKGTVLEANHDTKGDVIRRTLSELDCKILNDPAKLEKVAMVGDRRDDIIGAADCGVYSIGVMYGYSLGSELADHGAKKIVDTIAELKTFLLEE